MKSKLVLLLVAAAVVTGMVVAQESSQKVFTDTIDVNVLNLEIVVEDRDGVRAEGLGLDDFSLTVDGEPVAIDYFTEVRKGEYVQDVERYPNVRAGNRSGTSLLIFIDEFFAIPTDRDRVLRVLKERAANLDPADKVAICAWNGDELVFLTDWTSSPAKVEAAIDQAMKREALGLQRALDRRRFDITMEPDMLMEQHFDRSMYDPHRLSTQERQYTDLFVNQLQATVGAATAAMRGIAKPDSRAVYMVLSGGWPTDPASYAARSGNRAIFEQNYPKDAALYSPLSRTANLLGYTLYPVDLPGLQQAGGTSASRGAADPVAMGNLGFQLEDMLHDTLRYLADETGGAAILNQSRVKAFDDIKDDVRSFYWIGFTPDFRHDDSWRDIVVTVNNPELRVRTRSGYADLAPATQVREAVSTSLLFGPLVESNELTITVEDVQKADRKTVEADVTIQAPASRFTATKTDDGWTIELLLFFAAVDASGGRSDVPAIPLVMLSPAEPTDKTMITYKAKLKLNKKTKRLTAAMYDTIGGNTLVGTITKK